MLPEQKAVNASELILALQIPKSLPEQIAGSFKHNLNQNSLAKKTILSATLGLISEAIDIFYSIPLALAFASDGTKLPVIIKQ